MQPATSPRRLLHVGCGPRGQPLPPGFAAPAWQEIRFDIDPTVAPDVVGSMTKLDHFGDASLDAIFSSHSLEHLFEHEVMVALREFARVIRPEGHAVITCPDLQGIGRLLAEDRLVEAAFISPAGPIGALDVLFGYRPSLAQGNSFMAHHYGFTLTSLLIHLRQAGFARAGGVRLESVYELWVVASKEPRGDDDMLGLMRAHLPVARAEGLPVIS
jgi:SAM-dependent methyltransferase